MILQIPEVLSAKQVQQFREILNKASWNNAGEDSTATDSSLPQFPKDSDEIRNLSDSVLEALGQSQIFANAALPSKIFPPFFDRYEAGQYSGSYVDNAVRRFSNTNFRIRADLAATLFLNDPNEYEGGELVIDDNYGTHQIKLPAGHMILYPASALRFVDEVKSGTRLTSFFLVESMVRQDSNRAILFDLDSSIQSIHQDFPNHASLPQLTAVYQNLLRLWANV